MSFKSFDEELESYKNWIIKLLNMSDFWGGSLIDAAERYEAWLNLKKYNKEALDFLGGIWNKEKYYELIKTPLWKYAKKILFYLKSENYHHEMWCSLCNKEIIYTEDKIKATLHHKSYQLINLFHPDLIEFVHYRCHDKYHKEKKKGVDEF